MSKVVLLGFPTTEFVLRWERGPGGFYERHTLPKSLPLFSRRKYWLLMVVLHSTSMPGLQMEAAASVPCHPLLAVWLPVIQSSSLMAIQVSFDWSTGPFIARLEGGVDN